MRENQTKSLEKLNFFHSLEIFIGTFCIKRNSCYFNNNFLQVLICGCSATTVVTLATVQVPFPSIKIKRKSEMFKVSNSSGQKWWQIYINKKSFIVNEISFLSSDQKSKADDEISFGDRVKRNDIIKAFKKLTPH